MSKKYIQVLEEKIGDERANKINENKNFLRTCKSTEFKNYIANLSGNGDRKYAKEVRKIEQNKANSKKSYYKSKKIRENEEKHIRKLESIRNDLLQESDDLKYEIKCYYHYWAEEKTIRELESTRNKLLQEKNKLIRETEYLRGRIFSQTTPVQFQGWRYDFN